MWNYKESNSILVFNIQCIHMHKVSCKDQLGHFSKYFTHSTLHFSSNKAGVLFIQRYSSLFAAAGTLQFPHCRLLKKFKFKINICRHWKNMQSAQRSPWAPRAIFLQGDSANHQCCAAVMCSHENTTCGRGQEQMRWMDNLRCNDIKELKHHRGAETQVF